MNVKSNIRSLRIIAFFLFFTPALALIGSLVAHNIIVSFPFSHESNFGAEEDVPGATTLRITCNEDNEFCKNENQFESYDKLNKCNKYQVVRSILTETNLLQEDQSAGIVIPDIEKISKKLDKKIFLEWRVTNRLNEYCIINSDFLKFYDFAPILFEKIYELKNDKKRTALGTTVVVNPILYGEASISNIVKRFPIKLIFKPLMYLSVILMILYWYLNNLILNKLSKIEIYNKFYIFGVLSSIFLLFHVIFLGWDFESKILTQIRRSFIIFFILFELLAQAFLIREIFKRKSIISKYLSNIIVYCKLGFVFFVCLSSIIILMILLMINLDSKVDYILEWNYFLILLIFYLLSSLMWRKKIN